MEKKYPFEKRELKKIITNITSGEPLGKTFIEEFPYENLKGNKFEGLKKLKFEANLAGIRELGELHSKEPVKLERWKSSSGKYPVMVLIHGMGSSSNQELIKHIAVMYQKLGIPVVRINTDETKHPEMFELDHKSDFLVKVLERLHKIKWVDTSRIGIVAHSQGGVVLKNAATAIDELGLRPNATVPISSPYMKEDIERAAINAGFYIKSKHKLENMINSNRSDRDGSGTEDWENVTHILHPADLIVTTNMVNAQRIPKKHKIIVVASATEYNRQIKKWREQFATYNRKAANILGISESQVNLPNHIIGDLDLSDKQKEDFRSLVLDFKKHIANPYKYALKYGERSILPHKVSEWQNSYDPFDKIYPPELVADQFKLHNWKIHELRSKMLEHVAVATAVPFYPGRTRKKSN
ncbi:hypothetical protein HY989_06860 [Candidatus Micrarchaeota archaeon]|nr:hypothetical protein [Candidatus Micrarchaeota archaeon]